ncbi:MAG TPA: sugar phosphate isomerase/epimerase [Firmicutes bacterium]|nr:sugar phosphate isomerase/epimerase [Bacillota bacterium]
MAYFGVVSLSLSRLPFTEFLDFLTEIEADGFELTTVAGAHRGQVELATEEGRRRLSEQVAAAGRRILSLGAYNTFIVPAEALPAQVERLAGYIRLAAELGIPVVRAMGGELPEGFTREEGITALVEGFRQAARIAADHGVVLALENHGRFLQEADLLKEVVEKVDSPHFRLTLDTGNFCWAGRSIAEARAAFAALLPYVANVHLKDVEAGAGVRFVPAGTGQLAEALADLLHGLAKQDYSGPIQVEFEGAGDPRELLGREDPNIDRYLKSGTRHGLQWAKETWDSAGLHHGGHGGDRRYRTAGTGVARDSGICGGP